MTESTPETVYTADLFRSMVDQMDSAIGSLKGSLSERDRGVLQGVRAVAFLLGQGRTRFVIPLEGEGQIIDLSLPNIQRSLAEIAPDPLDVQEGDF